MESKTYEKENYPQNISKLRDQISGIGRHNELIRRTAKPNLLERVAIRLSKKEPPSTLELFLEQKRNIAAVLQISTYMQKRADKEMRYLKKVERELQKQLKEYKIGEGADDEGVRTIVEEGVGDLETEIEGIKTKTDHLKGLEYMSRRISLKSQRLSKSLEINYRFGALISEQKNLIGYVIHTIPAVNSFVMYCRTILDQGVIELEAFQQTYPLF